MELLPPYSNNGGNDAQPMDLGGGFGGGLLPPYPPYPEDAVMKGAHSHLDWLQMTFPAGFDLQHLKPFVGPWKPLEYGMLNYTRGFKAESGARAYSDGPERMGVHLIVTGEPLQNIRETGVTDRQWAEFAQEHLGRASRVDLTVNVIDGGFTVPDVVQAWQADKIKCPARAGVEDKGVKAPGHTLYLGSETSSRRARVYDKLAETRIKDPEAFEALKAALDTWVRFEVVARDERARGYMGALAFNDTEEVIRTAVRDFIKWEHPGYLAALEGPDVVLPELPRKPPAFWQWMSAQVVPAIVHYQQENPDCDVMAVLNGMVRQRLESTSPETDETGVTA